MATLLYLIEDLTFNNTPKLPLPSTSVPQYWGRGKKKCNEPKPAHLNQYSKKRKSDRYYDFDPRGAGQSNSEVLLRAVQSMHRDSMWGHTLRYKYVGLELSPERKMVLNHLRNLYETSLKLSEVTADFIDPLLSNSFGAHIVGTVGQAESELWHRLRMGRITASCLKDIAENARKFAEHFWGKKSDLSYVRSIMWGTKNEKVAKEQYERVHNRKVQEVGLFISKIHPMIGASPDGIIDNGRGLLEIKCPYSLRDNDLKCLTSGSFFSVSNGRLYLRRTHSYFYQVQCQMFVTGARYTDFFIYTTKGHHTERINYDHTFTMTNIYKAISGFRTFVIPEYFEHRSPRKLPIIEL